MPPKASLAAIAHCATAARRPGSTAKAGAAEPTAEVAEDTTEADAEE